MFSLRNIFRISRPSMLAAALVMGLAFRPACGQTLRLLPQAIARNGPVYFRLCRNEVPQIFTQEYAPEIGRGITLREGRDATILCCGG